MKKSIIIGIMVYFLCFISSLVHASGDDEWAKLVRGEFNIPPAIQEVKSVSEIQQYLDSNDEFTRMAAVKKIGQIGNADAVKALSERFEKEPYVNGRHMDPPLVPIGKEVLRLKEIFLYILIAIIQS